MKKFRVIFLLSLVVLCLCVLTACGGPQLPTPKNLSVDQDSLTLNWSIVNNALRYQVSINGEEKDVRTNSYSLTKLSEGEYKIKVKAVAKNNDEKIGDSNWSEEITFVREHETGLILTLNALKTEYQVTNMGTARGDIVIPDTYRGKPVTSIAKRAFTNKAALTSVVLGKNIKTINEQAFSRCSFLTSVVLNDGLEVIGEKAFQECRTLFGNSEEEGLVIPDSVTTIGANAFTNCRALQSVSVGKNVLAINDEAFADCHAMKTLVLGDGVQTIGKSAFNNCKELTAVTFGKNLVSIGDAAFYLCAKLAEINLNDGLTQISANAFRACANLEKVVLPDSVTAIGNYAFSENPALAEVTLGSGLQSLGEIVFFGSKLWEDTEGDVVVIDKWLVGLKDKTKNTYTVPDGIVGIANSAFANCSELNKALFLPNSLKYIGETAFIGCSKLGSVAIGSGVEKIGSNAFANDTQLTNVYLGAYDAGLGESSLKVIGAGAFYGCSLLSTIVIPETVTQIGSNAFNNTMMATNAVAQDEGVIYAGDWLVGVQGDDYAQIIEVKEGTRGVADYAFYNKDVFVVFFPDSVEIMGRGAFYGSQALYVELPSGLKEIPDYLFYKCANLGLDIGLEFWGVSIPSSVTKIGRSAFYKTGLTEIYIPNSVTEIDAFAFFGNEGLEEVVLGKNVERIGEKAFYGNISLKEIELPDSLTFLGEQAFRKCSALETVKIGSGLKTVPTRAFSECSRLYTLEIASGVENIGDYAFYKCEWLSVFDFGNTVKTIGNYAFYGCNHIRYLTLTDSVESIGKQAFRNCSKLTAVVISADTKIADHAFYGCGEFTFYTSATAVSDNWSAKWNSGYRPVVWGVTLSDNHTYVVALEIAEKTFTGLNDFNSLTAPERVGYKLSGWSTVYGAQDVEYTMEELKELPVGTTVYAVWERFTYEPDELPAPETPDEGEEL